MNIVLFISCLYAGGAERVICNLANYLSERGHCVEILIMAETDKTYELNSKVSVKTLLSQTDRKNKLYNIVIRFPRLLRYLKQHKDTEVYVVMLPWPTIILLAFQWMTKAKIVVSERNNPKVYSPVRKVLLKYLARKADGYVFQTEDVCEWYEKSLRKAKRVVIPNAVNKEFLVDVGDIKKEHIIISVGRLSEQKNFEMLIRAFHRIADKYADYRLVIYGEGKEREKLQKLILELELKERVFLPGNVTNIVDKYRKASVFALSSDYEGMPNVLIEAMAMGLPCVSTDCPCGGPKYLISSGKNGILVPVNETDKFTEALDKILSSKEYADSLGKEAIKIRDSLNEGKIYSQWEKFIKEVIFT